MSASAWITKRVGKKGVSHLVRWIEPETGIARSKAFRRLEDGREFLAKLRRDIVNNDYFGPVKISYDEWVIKHLGFMRNSPDVDVSPKTISSHSEALQALKRVCNPKGPIDITPKMIWRYRRVQNEAGLARPTINKHIATVRSALSYAVRAGIIPANKLLGPHKLLLRTELKQPRILEVGEVVALINAATDIKHKAVISLAFYHGLRRREICSLQWPDVDFDLRKLHIVSREGSRTKTRRSRTIALRGEAADLLSKLFKDRINNFVFETPGSFYWSCGQWFPELVKNAKLDPCGLHDLRKTCNTMMMDAGISREGVMAVLGHTTVKVNSDFYTGELTTQQRLAVDSLPSIG